MGSIAFHYISRRHPLTIKRSDDGIEVIAGLNLTIIAATIGIVVLFWIPRFFSGTDKTQPPPEDIKLVSSPKITSTFVRKYKSNIKELQKSFNFRVTFVRSDSEPDLNSSVAVKKIEISKPSDPNPFQIIEFSDAQMIFFTLYEKDERSFVVEDLNFDGYPDFRFYTSVGSGGHSFDCFLYDEGSGFGFDQDVSEIFWVSMVKVVPMKKQLHRYDKWCKKEIYQLDNKGSKFDLLGIENSCDDSE